MKALRTFGLFLFLVATTLLSQDARWVEKTFHWSGTGTMNTEPFPLFGEKFSVQYVSPQTGIIVIFVPLDRDSKQTLKNTSIVKTKSPVTQASRKNINTPIRDEAKQNDPALCWGYLFISGKGTWDVSVDQFLDTFQEWHLAQAMKGQKKPQQENLMGIWADKGNQSIAYTPTIAPWKISVKSEDDSNFNVKVRKADQKIYFEGKTSKAGVEKSGWIYSLEPVAIEVNCAKEEQRWSIEATAK